METMKIRTVIKEIWITETGKALKATNYIRGRIVGVHDMFDASEIKHAFAIDEKNDTHLVGYFEPESYEKFKNIIEDWYPGLCEFYYEES